ncbi:MAG: hypothetical protein IPM74_17765 [Crocinitomicaceae bacterium]|nr:hypothetical protein [Crocinitomicaceae bacterium]
MRADLSTMENIDRYLQGQMSGSELQQFESAMQHDAALSRMVTDQKLFVETVNRRALLAEINMVAGGGGGAWYTKPYFTVGGAIVGAGILTAVLYASLSNNESDTNLITDQNSVQTTQLTPEEEELISKDEAYFYSDSMASLEADDIQAPENNSSHRRMNAENTVFNSDDNVVSTSLNTIETERENSSNKLETDNSTELEEGEFYAPSKIKHAAFAEGDHAMQNFIIENMRFPGTAKEKKISGNVKVKFLVSEGGECTNIEANCFHLTDENDKPLNITQVLFNQKVANLFEREAARIVRIMPAWMPATDSFGNPVTEEVELYFKFSLKEGNLVYKPELGMTSDSLQLK